MQLHQLAFKLLKTDLKLLLLTFSYGNEAAAVCYSALQWLYTTAFCLLQKYSTKILLHYKQRVKVTMFGKYIRTFLPYNTGHQLEKILLYLSMWKQWWGKTSNTLILHLKLECYMYSSLQMYCMYTFDLSGCVCGSSIMWRGSSKDSTIRSGRGDPDTLEKMSQRCL